MPDGEEESLVKLANIKAVQVFGVSSKIASAAAEYQPPLVAPYSYAAQQAEFASARNAVDCCNRNRNLGNHTSTHALIGSFNSLLDAFPGIKITTQPESQHSDRESEGVITIFTHNKSDAGKFGLLLSMLRGGWLELSIH